MSSNIIIDGVSEDDVVLYLGLMNMAKLADPGPLGDVVVSFDLSTMRTNPKLLERDPENMHPVPKRVGGPNNNASQLQKVLCVESHLEA
jgi:hypothetical protein